MASQSSVNFTSYRVISEVTDGSYFGEISLVGNLPVTATAHAISNSIWGTLNKKFFLKYLNEFSNTKHKFYQQM